MDPQQPTVNPAGAPIVRQKNSGSYTREKFVRDLKKVTSKQPPEKPKPS